MERRLRQILPGYLFVVLLITVGGSIAAYVEHNNFTIGDWLINYSGGFVRRGLPGEILLQAARIFRVNLGVLVVALHTVFYALFFLFSFLLLRRTRIVPYLLLIISPFIFCFQINDLQGGYRKEIIYFALLGFLAYAKASFPAARFKKYFVASLLIFPLLILSHEMLAIYLPYVIVLGVWDGAPARKQYGEMALWCVPSLLSFLLCCVFHGTLEQENAIVASWSALDYTIRDGALAWVHFTPADGMNAVRLGFASMPYPLYIPALALSLVAFFPIYPQLRLMLKDRSVTILMAGSLLGSIALAAAALDWGRFLYIHLVSWFFLSLVGPSVPAPSFRFNGLGTTMAVIWALFFHIPHWPGQGDLIAIEWKQINFVRSLVRVLPVLNRPEVGNGGADEAIAGVRK